MKPIYITLVMLAVACWNAQPAGAGAPANSNLINLVVVGYDIEKNAKAQEMVRDMAQSARDAGAIGEVIMAGQDQAQLDKAMQQAMTIATQSPKPDCRLDLKTTTVAPGETIVAIHSDFPVEDRNAWIAFYEKSDDRDEDYLSYTFLANLKDRTYDVQAPEKPGREYHFRLFKSKAYDCAARSEAVIVAE